jgi:CBS domain containing-hemolysin-like protein
VISFWDVLTPFELAALAVLLLLSGFFSGSETALFSLQRGRLDEMARGAAHRRGTLVARLLSRPHDLLVTILFGNLMVNVLFFAISSVAAFRLERAGEHTLAVAAGLAGLVLVVVFGEVIPKSGAVVAAERFALVVSAPLTLLSLAVRPLLGLFLRFSDSVTRGIVPDARPPVITGDELKKLVELSQGEGLIGPHERGLMERVVELGQVSVREVMLPRVDMPLFRLGQPREELVSLIESVRPHYVAVYRGTIDAVVGVVRSERVLLEAEVPVDELLEPVTLVPESRTVEQLLSEFRREGIKSAVVVDEYGGTSGWVELDDLVEAVVGEVPDELEPPEALVEALGPRSYLVDARLGVREWEDLIGTELEEHPELGAAEPVTLGGFVVALLGHWPRKGEEVAYRNLRFTVVELRGRRLGRIRLDLLPLTEDGEAGNQSGASGI